MGLSSRNTHLSVDDVASRALCLSADRTKRCGKLVVGWTFGNCCKLLGERSGRSKCGESLVAGQWAWRWNELLRSPFMAQYFRFCRTTSFALFGEHYLFTIIWHSDLVVSHCQAQNMFAHVFFLKTWAFTCRFQPLGFSIFLIDIPERVVKLSEFVKRPPIIIYDNKVGFFVEESTLEPPVSVRW